LIAKLIIMKITIVNTHDIVGGAERNSFDLFQLLSKKHFVRLIVGAKYSNQDGIIPVKYFPFENFIFRYFRKKLGITEIFYLTPFRKKILKYIFNSDIIHIHNIHGRYWSLISIPIYSYFKKIIITLHDEFLLTGDCAYSKSCNKWIHSCGKCPQINHPDIDRYPATGMDNTRVNLLIKKFLFFISKKSNIVITVPSLLLLNKAKLSYVRNMRLYRFPYGINTSYWLGLISLSAQKKYFNTPFKYVIFIANNVSEQRKGFQYLINNYSLFQQNNLKLIVVGRCEQLNINYQDFPFFHFLGTISCKTEIRSLISNAQCTLIPSVADNFPFVGLESLACGIPILTTNDCGLHDILASKSQGMAIPLSYFKNGDFMDILLQIINDLGKKPHIRFENAELIKKNYSYKSMEANFLKICNSFR
jgi:glycosyltransferase involved in cell wall biosynthesis